MKTTQLLFVWLWMPLSFSAQSQTHTSKLIVTMGKVLELSSDSLHFDTLIMQDNSRIVFLAPETKLVIENAFIGKNCTWDASGQSARKQPKQKYGWGQYGGGDGNPGRSIHATVLFQFLGELTINAKGEYGHMGARGFTGSRGADGSNYPAGSPGGNGGMGGNGGNGGTISLSYAGDGFSPLINEGGFRSIYLDCRGGRGSIGGRPGKGGRGGMPTLRFDYSHAGPAVAPHGQLSTDGPEGKLVQWQGSVGPSPLNPVNAIVEWEGQRGLDGRMGRMGLGGEDGQNGVIMLNKLN